MIAADRVSFEFWDADGNFIEDTFFSMTTGFGIQVVRFEPPINIPPSGFVSARIQTQFSPNAASFVVSVNTADSPAGSGLGMISAETPSGKPLIESSTVS